MQLAADSEMRSELRKSRTFCRLCKMHAKPKMSNSRRQYSQGGHGVSLKGFSLSLVTFLIFSLLLAVNGLDQVYAGDVKVDGGPSHHSSSSPSTTTCPCPPGYTCDPSGGCIPTGSTGCPPGYTVDPHTGVCVPLQQWFQYQTTEVKYDKVSVRVTIRPDSGKGEWQGIASFLIKMDEKDVGSITSGQTGTAKLYAGTCYKSYFVEQTTGWTQYQGEQCQDVIRQHKVELSLPVGPAGDQKCPTGGARCFLDPGTSDIRYYLVSDPVQYKGDGETAEFIFKIEYRWYFATFDNKGNPIDLTRYGFGFRIDGRGPWAEGSELLEEGSTLTNTHRADDVVEISPRDTRYVYDHVVVLDLPSDVGRILDPGERVVMDGPKAMWAYWQRQYYFTVNGECLTSSGAPFTCGNPQGEGYYNEGATATFSSDSRVRDFSWMGTLGGFYQFDRWRGDSTSRTSTATITMDSPKRVTAIYNYNDTTAIRNIGILVSLGILPPGILIWVMTRRHRRRPPPPPPRFPAPGVPPRGWPPGAVPPRGWPPGAGPPPGGPGWTTTPIPPRPPGLGPTPTPGGPGTAPPGTTGPGAGRPPTGPVTGGPGTGGPGAGAPTEPGVARPRTGPGAGPPSAPGAGAGPRSVGREAPTAGREGVEAAERPTGAGAVAAAAGLGAAGIGAVALARRRGNKCVWCGSRIKRDQIVCPRCGVHQECPTCGTPLYKSSIVSKGYGGSPEDLGLFCDNCNLFTS